MSDGSAKPGMPSPKNLISLLSQKVIGQTAAVEYVVPYIEMFHAGLAPEGRPVGVFLLLGPTGTGKTKTVEALAEILHGSEKSMVKIDCGEFQMDHEVAKLIGAPPGYLGHRETQPMINDQKLASVTSDDCGLSLVLFDEIEKAAPSLTRLLLGILDKATLRLGDNTTVNFEKSLIFLTSNLGAREMMKELRPDFGFQAGMDRDSTELVGKLESIALGAVRRKFSPEFVNRIDVVVTYQPLDSEALSAILDQQIAGLQQHVNTRLSNRCFQIEVSPESREFLLRKGTSAEYGARELKRTIHRHLVQPLATMVANGSIPAGARVNVELREDGEGLGIRAVETVKGPPPTHPVVLLVDDNQDLLRFMEALMEGEKWKVLAAETAEQAREQCAKLTPHVAVVDYLLPDGNGVTLAVELVAQHRGLQVIMTSGGQLSDDDHSVRQKYGFLMLPKPFLANDILATVRSRLSRLAGASA